MSPDILERVFAEIQEDELVELALALVSEIQAVFAGASAESLRDRKVPIHGWNVARQPAPPPPKECATSAP